MKRGLALTITGDGRLNVISCAVSVGTPSADTVNPKASQNYKAIWDTGATGTVITRRVATELGIAPSGVITLLTVGGTRDSDTYLVDIRLPNRVDFANIRVTEGILGDADVLIGMDIICQGDFAITNVGGKTIASYRVPSLETIDYVKEGPQGFFPTNRSERRQLEHTGHLQPGAPAVGGRPKRPRR